MSFSIAMAFSCSNLRAVNRRPTFLLISVLTCIGRNTINPHHLRDAARIVAVALVDLRLEKGLRMTGYDADCR